MCQRGGALSLGVTRVPAWRSRGSVLGLIRSPDFWQLHIKLELRTNYIDRLLFNRYLSYSAGAVPIPHKV